eukprot:UN21024
MNGLVADGVKTYNPLRGNKRFIFYWSGGSNSFNLSFHSINQKKTKVLLLI